MSPSTFLVTLTFLLSLRANEQARAIAFFWAGAAAGLAGATKYTGVLALLLPLIAAWMTHGVRPSRLAATRRRECRGRRSRFSWRRLIRSSTFQGF